jgi:hypothetical protein
MEKGPACSACGSEDLLMRCDEDDCDMWSCSLCDVLTGCEDCGRPCCEEHLREGRCRECYNAE